MGRALRRAAGAVVVVSLLVAAAGYYRYFPEFALTAGHGSADSAEPAQHSVSPAVTPLPSPSAAPTTTAPKPEATPSTDGRPAAIRLVVRVDGRGVFEVTETVRLPAPVTRLHLAPPDVRLAGGSLSSARPVVTDVDLRAGGRRVRLPGRSVRRPTTVRLRSATDQVTLRYRLHQTIRRNKMSTPGRAIGAVAPVLVGVPDEVPVAVAFRSAAVLNLTCPCLTPAQQTCFAGHRPTPRVGIDLARKDALVVVQLDLRKA